MSGNNAAWGREETPEGDPAAMQTRMDMARPQALPAPIPNSISSRIEPRSSTSSCNVTMACLAAAPHRSACAPRRWRLFDHQAHLGGAAVGSWYARWGERQIWENPAVRRRALALREEWRHLGKESRS